MALYVISDVKVLDLESGSTSRQTKYTTRLNSYYPSNYFKLDSTNFPRIYTWILTLKNTRTATFLVPCSAISTQNQLDTRKINVMPGRQGVGTVRDGGCNCIFSSDNQLPARLSLADPRVALHLQDLSCNSLLRRTHRRDGPVVQGRRCRDRCSHCIGCGVGVSRWCAGGIGGVMGLGGVWPGGMREGDGWRWRLVKEEIMSVTSDDNEVWQDNLHVARYIHPILFLFQQS